MAPSLTHAQTHSGQNSHPFGTLILPFIRAFAPRKRQQARKKAEMLQERFRVGVVGRPRVYRQETCPMWVRTQHRHRAVVNIGLGNSAAHAPCGTMHAFTSYGMRQHILRHIF